MKELGFPRERIYQVISPRSRNGLYVAFTAVGVLGGLFARDIIDADRVPTNSLTNSINSPQNQSSSPTEGTEQPLYEPLYEATIAQYVHDALFPSPTLTPTSTPTSTPRPDPNANLDFCGSIATPGTDCVIPKLPEPTKTPTPSFNCNVATPVEHGGDICTWPTMTKTEGGV